MHNASSADGWFVSCDPNAWRSYTIVLHVQTEAVICDVDSPFKPPWVPEEWLCKCRHSPHTPLLVPLFLSYMQMINNLLISRLPFKLFRGTRGTSPAAPKVTMGTVDIGCWQTCANEWACTCFASKPVKRVRVCVCVKTRWEQTVSYSRAPVGNWSVNTNKPCRTPETVSY